MRVGIKEVWVLERTGEPNSAGRYAQPRVASGNFLEREFWSKAVNNSQ